MATVPAPPTSSTRPAAPIPEQQEKMSATYVYDAPTMNLSIFVVWILPLLAIALYGRLLADVTPITIPVDNKRPSPPPAVVKAKPKPPKQPSAKTSSRGLSVPASWPTSYVDTIKAIHKRRRRIPGFPGDVDNMFPKDDANKHTNSREEAQSTTRSSVNMGNKKPQSPSRDSQDEPAKAQLRQQIADLQGEFRRSGDLMRGILAADAMRYYTMQYHEGGTYERECIQLYRELIQMAETLRKQSLYQGKPLRRSDMPVNQEVILDYKDKSPDGLLCGLHTAFGKSLFLASLFESAVQAYDQCLNEIDTDYLDARNARGSAYIVLGRYDVASDDLLHVVRKDHNRFFVDAFSGMARVLEAKEEVVAGGWDSLIEPTKDLIAMYEYKLKVGEEGQAALAATALARLHHVLFTYHEKKTNAYSTAFDHLEQAHQYKLSTLPPWNGEMEKLKVKQLQAIFQKGFWDTMPTGSSTKVPVFIIGFVRSGSTLLERILDAHPDIVGTGEDSVFNGRLGEIRNAIVKASHDGDLVDVTKTLADSVITEMYRRWSILDAANDSTARNRSSNTTNGVNNDHKNNNTTTKSKTKKIKPKRLADKMLTNYYNVGFIEMLYPNALILHVAREPMDSVFSAFKHDFPTGTLDYTSDVDGVTDLYHAYRDVMDHWDKVLPGRITHVRYEDMVNDFEGTARAIIQATGLPWNDSVLEFHKQKHAVNTYSSTQVRKGVYKSGMQFWKRYEKELAPLVQKIGARVKYDLKSTLPGYRPPPPTDESKEEAKSKSQRRTDEL